MRIPKLRCERCGKDVSINFVTSEPTIQPMSAGFKIGILAQCSECGACIKTTEAIEQEVYRFLSNCIFGAMGGAPIYGPSGIINQKEVKSYDTTRKN